MMRILNDDLAVKRHFVIKRAVIYLGDLYPEGTIYHARLKVLNKRIALSHYNAFLRKGRTVIQFNPNVI